MKLLTLTAGSVQIRTTLVVSNSLQTHGLTANQITVCAIGTVVIGHSLWDKKAGANVR